MVPFSQAFIKELAKGVHASGEALFIFLEDNNKTDRGSNNNNDHNNIYKNPQTRKPHKTTNNRNSNLAQMEQ
jgi:hypothetical protein